MSESRRPGRPPENREKVTLYIHQETIKKLRALVDTENPSLNTLGKVLDGLLSGEVIAPSEEPK